MPAQTRIAATRISSSCALLMILGVASHGKPPARIAAKMRFHARRLWCIESKSPPIRFQIAAPAASFPDTPMQHFPVEEYYDSIIFVCLQH